jgi:hypothetical protein
MTSIIDIPPGPALSVLTPAAADDVIGISDFAELTAFNIEGEPMWWRLLRRHRAEVRVVHGGAGAPPWNDAGLPPAFVLERRQGMEPSNAAAERAVRALKLRTWLESHLGAAMRKGRFRRRARVMH